MRRRLAVLSAVAAIAALGATPATAASLCWDVDVAVNGDAVADEAGCQELPA